MKLLVVPLLVFLVSTQAVRGQEAKQGDELRQLLQERVLTLSKLVELNLVRYRQGMASVGSVITCQRKLLDAELELERDPVKRMKLLNRQVARAKDVLKEAEKRWKARTAGLTEVLEARTALLAVRIRLLRLTAKVVEIKDGDSIFVVQGGKKFEVRLEGIDCPELDQDFGNKAKKMTSDLASGKQVALRITGTDIYGRTLAQVVLPCGTELNQELVKKGFAWWFRKYSNDKRLEKLENQARQRKRGLWADPKPVAPWDWRAKAKVSASDIKIVPNGVSISALLPNPVGDDEGKEQATITNSTKRPVDLAERGGWKLIDKAGKHFVLSGKVAPGKSLTITMKQPTMQLNNDGDTVVLVDSKGVGRSRVDYSGRRTCPL